MFKLFSKKTSAKTEAGARSSKTMSFIFWIVAALAVLGPFLFIPTVGLSVTTGKGFIIILAIIAILLGFGVHVLRKGEITVPKNTIFIFIATIVFGGLLSTIFSPAFSMSLFGYGFETTTWMWSIVFAVLFFFSYLVASSHNRIGGIYAGLFVGTLVLIIVHILRYVFGPATANFGVLDSTLASFVGSWGDFAVLLGLVLVGTVVALETVSLKKWIRFIMVLFAGAAAVLLAFMNVKIVWIIIGFTALLVSLYLFSFAYWDPSSKSYSKKNRIPGYALMLVAISIGCLFFGSWLNTLASNHQNISFNDIRPSIQATGKVAWESFTRNPVTGYGPNMFGPAWTMIKPKALSGSPVSDVDFNQGFGYIPSQMATNGLVGIIGWGGFIIFLAIILIRKMSKGFEDPVERFFTISLGFLTFYLGAIAVMYVPGQYPLILFAILGGMAVAVGQDDAKRFTTYSFIKDPRASFFGIIAVMGILVLAAWGGYTESRKLASWVNYAQGIAVTDDVAKAATFISRATALASHDVYHTRLVGLANYRLNQLIADRDSQSSEVVSQQAEQILGNALGHAQAAVDANPANYRNWILLGDTYRTMVSIGMPDAADKAKSAYQEAQWRNPLDATNLLPFAQLTFASGDKAGAIKTIKQSINDYPTSRAYVALAQIDLADKNYTSAITSLEQAVRLDPSNAELAYQYGLLLFSQKRYSGAVVAFGRAISANRAYGPAYVYLGVSYERSGDTKNAEAVYEFVKKQFTDGEKAIADVKSGTVETPDPSTAVEDSEATTDAVAPAPKKQ